MICTNEVMDAKIDRLDNLERRKKVLERQIEELKDEIKLNLSGYETVETDKYVIRWLEVIQNRFDTTAFKKIHTALYDQFLKPTTARRFSYNYR